MIRKLAMIFVFLQIVFVCSLNRAMDMSVLTQGKGPWHPYQRPTSACAGEEGWEGIEKKLEQFKQRRHKKVLLKREVESCLFDFTSDSYDWMLKDDQGEQLPGKAYDEGRLFRLYTIRQGLVRHLNLFVGNSIDIGFQCKIDQLVYHYHIKGIPFPYNVEEVEWLLKEEKELESKRTENPTSSLQDPTSPPRKKQKFVVRLD